MARGQLRIYLGAAPGVGKTYAMLAEGQRRLARGADVVGGLIETHGRRLTAAMAEGLEIVPRRTMSYRGTIFTEMDVDAVLARHPQIALVDELAHTNVPGSRNAKRWQDVGELLDAGIADQGPEANGGPASLALRLAGDLAEAMGDTLRSERTPAGGRTVVLTLPAARPSSAGPTALPKPAIGAQTMRKASAGGK